MRPNNLKEQESPYLDKMLAWYDKTKKQDELEIKKSKINFINEIKMFNKDEIKNTEVVTKKITVWQRIKRVLGIG